MASKQSKGILYTFPGNLRAYKAQIAAQFSGAQVTIAGADAFKMNETNRSEAFLKKFPTGKVPAYEDQSGLCLFEANAIAHYLSNDQLRGQTLNEQSEVLQWIEYGEREINPVSVTLVYPCLGILQFNRNNNEQAKEQLKHILQVLDEYLRTRTYLVGERITLADVTIACDLLHLFQWIIEPAQRDSHSNVTRWFMTLIHQKEFQAVVGMDYKLCEKAGQFDARKYAELTRGNQKPKEQATAAAVTTDEAAHGGKAKKEKKAAKPAPQPVKVEKEQAPAVAEEEEEIDEIYADEPKQNDPFSEMPKPSLNFDEFKRIYSNEDTATVAVPYFWKNFDNENCSIWFCEYKYPEELTKVFMTCNLVTGFFQRLDKLRKNSFGSMCVFGENDNNTIAGIWFWRGHELAFQLSPDWQVDYESYSWKRLSLEDENTKPLVNQYLLWEGEHDGKKFNQGKIFK